MGLFSFLRRERPQPLRAYVATKRENLAITRKREETTAALRRYVTERQLLAAVENAVSPSIRTVVEEDQANG
jgi:hypothetical protein